MVVDRVTLKEYFEKGDFPTESQFVDLIDSVYNFVNDNETGIFEQKIHIPSTQPVIVTGTPNILTFDMLNNRQAIYEPRLSAPVLSINIDFDWRITNDDNAIIMSAVLSLTGTRIITFEADVFSAPTPSTISTWVTGTKTLTITAGTDDLIEFNLLRYSTSSKWILVVGEVAV